MLSSCFSRQCLRLARHQISHCRAVSSLGGLPSEFQVDPRTQQLIDDIDNSVLSFGKGQDYSPKQEVEVTGNDMTLDSLIKLGMYTCMYSCMFVNDSLHDAKLSYSRTL